MTSRRTRRPPFSARPEDGIADPIKPRELRQLRRLGGFVRPYKARLTLAIVAVAVATAMGLVFPLVIGNLVDTALVTNAEGDASSLNRIALILLGVFAVQAVFNYVKQFQLSAVGEGVVADLRIRLYGHLMLLSVKLFESRKTGEITSRLTSDVAVVQSTVSQSVAQVAGQTLTLIGGVVLLFVISAKLSAAVLVVLPVVILSARFFGRRLELLSTEFQDKVAEANAVAEESIAGIRVVQWFGAERSLVDRYAGSIDDSYRLALRRARLRALFMPIVQFVVLATVSLVLWFGGRLVLAGEMTGDIEEPSDPVPIRRVDPRASLRRRLLCVFGPRRQGAARGWLRGIAGRDHRPGRPKRGGQVDPRAADRAVLRPVERDDTG